MSISIYDASVPVLIRMYGNLAAILEKAGAWASVREIDEAVLLQARLFPDMFPFVRQVQIATDVGTRGVDRLAGREVAQVEDTEASFAELVERLRAASARLKSVDPGDMAGAESREVVLDLRGRTVTFRGQDYLLNFVWPNVFFHITTAYNILRHNGLDLGKRDYLGELSR
jgi:hypothetical protein